MEIAMIWIARTLLFTLTLFIGLSAVWFWSSIAFHEFGVTPPISVSVPDGEALPHLKDTGISVAYAGWEAGATAEDQPYLNFLIHNGTFQLISYAAHTPDYIFPHLTVNGGKEMPLLGCGTGIKRFYILPGTSAMIRVHKFTFRNYLSTKKNRFNIGFFLSPAVGESGVYRSPKFELPQEFLDQK